jgi:hypothetical protein
MLITTPTRENGVAASIAKPPARYIASDGTTMPTVINVTAMPDSAAPISKNLFVLIRVILPPAMRLRAGELVFDLAIHSVLYLLLACFVAGWFCVTIEFCNHQPRVII